MSKGNIIAFTSGILIGGYLAHNYMCKKLLQMVIDYGCKAKPSYRSYYRKEEE